MANNWNDSKGNEGQWHGKRHGYKNPKRGRRGIGDFYPLSVVRYGNRSDQHDATGLKCPWLLDADTPLSCIIHVDRNQNVIACSLFKLSFVKTGASYLIRQLCIYRILNSTIKCKLS